jgi:beta-N-acetylhexosaminidase
LDADLAAAARRPVVLVVRDLHRHPWQRRLAATLLAARPDAVVVEMGLPAERPRGASAWVRTYGASAVSAVAAAEALLGYGCAQVPELEGR